MVLYELSEGDEQALDRWDGATSAITASSGSGSRRGTATVLAWLYVLNDYEGGLPSARYLGIMADAAEAAGAPPEYVSWLRTGRAGRWEVSQPA